jgi:dephospho-CoA kinase
MNRIIALVGMTGCGKTEVAEILKEKGLSYVRFGDLTMEELKKRGLEINEKNERMIRESLRKEHGMAVYAKLSAPKLEEALKHGSVIADGLYSWQEYLFLREKFGSGLVVVAVYASPGTRYRRLSERKIRPLANADAASRDRSEIENLDKAGPIAMADYTIVNEDDMAALRESVEWLWNKTGGK